MNTPDSKIISFAFILNEPSTANFWTCVGDALGNIGIATEFIHGKPASSTIKRAEKRAQNGLDYCNRASRSLLPRVTLLRALARSNAQAFICIEYSLSTLFSIVSARLRQRRVLIFQEHAGRMGKSLGTTDRIYRRLLGTFAHALIANTDAAYDEIKDVLRIPSEKIYRATLLVPPERIMLTGEVTRVREPSYRPLFVFVGKLIRRKNVAGLLDAATELEKSGYDFSVWVIGDGPERAVLEMKAGRLADEDRVRFLGPLPANAIGSIYRIADAFVMPSFRDYRSVAVLEALRFGKLVITSSQDGNSTDFVRHEETGLVFDPFEKGALVAAMKRAIIEPNTMKDIARRGEALMSQHTPHTAAIALSEVLTDVSTT